MSPKHAGWEAPRACRGRGADPIKRTLVLDEAVAYHEGVPGHHMQISIAQTLQGLPKFRLHGFYSAYTEGWALYAEELGKRSASTRIRCPTTAGQFRAIPRRSAGG